MEMTEEDFEILNEFILEGNGQGFNEMTEMDYDNETTVEIIDRNKK